MGLVQRAVSVMLYGNSVAKQVRHMIFTYCFQECSTGICKPTASEFVLDVSGHSRCYQEIK